MSIDKDFDRLIEGARETKKPEKKKLGGEEILLAEEVMGYNQACDDWETYSKQCWENGYKTGKENIEATLPSEEEIIKVVKDNLIDYCLIIGDRNYYPFRDNEEDFYLEAIAKAIYKRIRGEV